ncbi:hypothetical protein [Okeania sp. SIO2B3]|nr:hypothetical protein [Okeania sp. SIO2B3]NET42576.1 hypothetical protein [Okeania sp. SIO2B3]
MNVLRDYDQGESLGEVENTTILSTCESLWTQIDQNFIVMSGTILNEQ